MKIKKNHAIGVGLLLLLLLLICNSCSNNPTAVEDQVSEDVIRVETTLVKHVDNSLPKRLRDSIDVLNAKIVILEWNLCISKQMTSATLFRVGCYQDFILSEGLEPPVCPGRTLDPTLCE